MGLCKRSEKAEITEVKPEDLAASGGVIKMKKQIGLFQGVAIIVGIIIGSGIFVSPVGILQNVRSVGMSFVLWVVCGIYNALGAVCYAELGTMIPQSGGEYVYIRRAFGDMASFVCLWIDFLLICPVGIAAMGLMFAVYLLKPIYPDCDIPETPQRLLAALITTLLIAVNCVNVKWATRVQVVITISKLVALASIIVIGFYFIGKGETESFENSFEDSDVSAGAIALAFYSGFWAYSGWSYLNFLVDELVNPVRNLPLAIFISMTLVIAVYLLANVAYLGVLSPLQMLSSPAVAVTFASQTLGPLKWVMPILIAISVSGTMNGTALSMSRLFFIGAGNNHLPQFVSMINYKRLTPMPSLLIILTLTLIFQNSGDIFYLIEMEGFGFASILVMTFASQVYLRFKEPDLERPIKVPIALPAVLCLISFAIVVLTFYQKPHESFLALGLVAGGIVLYCIGGKWQNKPKSIQDKIDWVNKFIQKLLLVVPPAKPEDLQFE
ncbi:large neutral amino acids transporter small subunit 1-like [Mercenaria mercenaria]|uniref:large neutral amino acids transporter small subunit 1-like n=1 Tax=Mercenaria mercenaria TaxID=6596 RepID=UPI001E1D489A|nr:large neutral amino acids transporter small subunit 1-like [Mercenaria mercenaria]